MKWINCSVLLTCLISAQASAQIIPDGSLPDASNPITEGNTIIINGGTASEQNLFHSFEQFSLSNGQVAHFNNPLNIQNIFSRVTGSSLSNLDGILRANGAANLFFVNF